MNQVCSICSQPLVKQPIKNGLPLTHSESSEYHNYKTHDSKILECKSCGDRCFNKSLQSGGDGYGLCKQCGGNDGINKPRWFNQHISKQINYLNIWSCPIHGVK